MLGKYATHKGMSDRFEALECYDRVITRRSVINNSGWRFMEVGKFTFFIDTLCSTLFRCSHASYTFPREIERYITLTQNIFRRLMEYLNRTLAVTSR